MRKVTRQVLDWFKDRAVRKVVRYGIPAAIGKLVMSLAGLVTMALLAHQLGPGPFGVIAIMRTVVSIVEQYANFNTWQVVVRYGIEAIARNSRYDVERVIKLAVVVDLVTGTLGAVVIAGIALLVPSVFDWSLRESLLCALYAVTIVTRVTGASDGIFRICDAYRAQAISSSVAAGVITIAVAVATGLGAGFEGCIYALVIGEVIGNAITTFAAFAVARDHGFGAWPRAHLAGMRTTYPGIVRFMLAANAQLSVKKTSTELDMVVVGAMIGDVASGLFRVVKQLGTIPGRIFLPFEQVVFTELAKSAASHDYAGFRRLLFRFTALIAIGSLATWGVAALVAEPLLELVAGPAFVPAAAAFRWYLLAMVLVIATAPSARAIVALDRPGALFVSELIALGFLVGAIVFGAYQFGVVGVSVAIVIQRALLLVASLGLVAQSLRQRERTNG